MQQIDSAASLNQAILQLEAKQAEEGIRLKEEFHHAYESVKPGTLIKNVIKQAVGSPDLKDNLVTTSVGLGAALLSRVLFQSLTKSPIKKAIGTALLFGLTNVVARNPEIVRSLGHKFFGLFRSKQSKMVNGEEHQEST